MSLKQTEQKYQGLTYRIKKFKKGYQPRTKFVKDENGYLLPDFHSILYRWKNYFCGLLNIHGINNDRHTEMHTVGPLALEPSSFKVKIATEKLNRYK
jgi:hypothetical protein